MPPEPEYQPGFILSEDQVRSAWRQAFAAGHGDCGGLTHDSRDDRVLCACGAVLLDLAATA